MGGVLEELFEFFDGELLFAFVGVEGQGEFGLGCGLEGYVYSFVEWDLGRVVDVEEEI